MAIWDGYQEPTPAPVTPKPQPKQSSGGGLGGAIYNLLIKPTADAVGGGISDIPKIGESVYNLGRITAGAVTGNKKAVNNAAKDQSKTLANSNFFKNYTNVTQPGYDAGDIGGNLEKSVGKAGNQVIDITAPVTGIGKTGARALAKTGALLGGAQGAFGSMEQGQGADQTIGSAITGGTVGGIAGGVLGKLAGAPGKTSNILSNKAAKYGAQEGINTRAAQAKDFAGLTPSDLKGAMAHTKSGEPLGLNGISDHLRNLGMEPNAQNMKLYSDTVLNKIGGHMQDMLGDVTVPVGSPADVGRNFIVNNAGTLGGLKSRTGAAVDTMNQIRSLVGDLGSSPAAPDVLSTISRLESAASGLGKAAQAGDRVAIGQQGAYKAVADHLREALSNHKDVNAIVNDFKMPSAGSQLLRDEVTNSGGSDQLSSHVLDTLNNAKTYQDLKSAMQPAIVARNLAKSADEAAQYTVPKPLPGAGGNAPGELNNVYEGASALRGNPIAAATLLAKLGGGLDKVAGKAAATLDKGAYQEGVKSGLRGEMPSAGTPSGLMSRQGAVVAPMATNIGSSASDILSNPSASQPAITPDTNQQLPDDGTAADVAFGAPGTDQSIPASPYSEENMMADVARDPKHMSDYISLYKTLNPANNTANATQQKNILANKNAASTLRQIEASFNQAGGGQGAIGGNIANLLGEFGANSGVKTYNDTATALAASLYKALGNTGTITDRDQAMISRLIPKTTDTAATAQSKITQLETLLQQAQENAAGSSAPSYSDNQEVLQGLGMQ